MNRARLTAIPAFVSVTTLFFAWGFISSNNDPLIATLKASFDLNYTQALLTQLVFFAAYGFMSIPAAALLNRAGAVNTILIALATMVGRDTREKPPEEREQENQEGKQRGHDQERAIDGRKQLAVLARRAKHARPAPQRGIAEHDDRSEMNSDDDAE